MATQKNASSGRKSSTTKKSTSSGRKNTTKKNTSSGKKTSGRNEKKEAQGPDLVTVIVVLIAVVLVVVLISKYKKENEGGQAGNPTGTVAATGTSIPDAPTKTTDAPTKTPAQTATKAPEATATPLPPTPTEEPVLSQTNALKIVNGIIELENYTIELLDDHLMIDGVEYYAFCVNDENGESMEPLLIVNKKTGELLCYDLIDGAAPIERFPLDKTETGSDGAELLTADEAKAMLAGYTAERLGLAKAPSGYEMTADDWPTMANGKECYGINFFEEIDGKQKYRGTFYVALDGSVVFGQDEITGEFIER